MELPAEIRAAQDREVRNLLRMAREQVTRLRPPQSMPNGYSGVAMPDTNTFVDATARLEVALDSMIRVVGG